MDNSTQHRFKFTTVFSVSIVLAYTEAWLRGIGCIPLNHHMVRVCVSCCVSTMWPSSVTQSVSAGRCCHGRNQPCTDLAMEETPSPNLGRWISHNSNTNFTVSARRSEALQWRRRERQVVPGWQVGKHDQTCTQEVSFLSFNPCRTPADLHVCNFANKN